MLGRIAHVVTFLTFGLLTTILGFGAVAVHDFNHPNLASGNSHIFVREYHRHADFNLGYLDGQPVGYQINYTVCGRPDGDFGELQQGLGVGKILESATPMYGYTSTIGYFPGKIYRPISDDDARRLGLVNRKPDNESSEWGRSTRRICQVDLTGIWSATRSFIRSLT